MGNEAPLVVVSYSHKDKKWLDELLPHLHHLKRNRGVEHWDDTQLKIGARWYDQIRHALGSARYAILLVSKHFLASEFVQEEEVPYLLTQENRGRLELLPIIVGRCDWESEYWLERLQHAVANVVGAEDPDKAFTKCVRQIREAVDSGAALSPPRKVHFRKPTKVDIGRLPETDGKLFGRHQEIKDLFEAWADKSTNIVSLKAAGGVGKSALVLFWTKLMEEDNYREAEYVYAWSFYSQGTDRASSADEFVNDALQFFGDPNPTKGSAWDKGERLAELVQRQPTLLLLDGMEPLQSAHDFERGAIKDPALRVLIEHLAEKNPGLCVISTRETVREFTEDDFEFGDNVQEVDLETVSTPAGRALLRAADVEGSDEALEALVEQFGHHALGLNLLARYLTWEGNGGPDAIPALEDIPVEKGRHARRVMAAFADLFGEAPERDLLRMMGLFDGPVGDGEIEALVAKPHIAGLNAHVSRQDALVAAQRRLREAKLLAEQSKHEPERLDTHPLVREHFGAEMQADLFAAWRDGHGRLFEYYQEAAEHQPDSLEGLAPLYAAVAHGCGAGRFGEAFGEVFWARIIRRQEFYSTKKLGAFGSDLAAVSNFFLTPWWEIAEDLPDRAKGFLFNGAGFRLRALGRLREAAEPMKAGMEADVARRDWKNAAIAAGNLSGLYLTIGDVTAAVEYGRRGVEYADRSGDWRQQMAIRAAHADPEHQAGNLTEAADLFREAERMQGERQPAYPLLYSLQGYQYCDLLLGQGQADEARRRASKTLEWVKPQNWLLDIALDHLTLGRAALALDDFGAAREQLDEAVDGLRASGNTDDVPRGLLARAAFHRSQRDFAKAHSDLRETKKIAQRGGMRLFLTDYHLGSALLALAEAEHATEFQQRKVARDHLEQARKLVEETGYHRRDPEVAKLDAQLNGDAKGTGN